MPEEKKVEESAEKAGEVVGKGLKKGFAAAKAVGTGLKKGVKGEDKKRNRNLCIMLCFSHFFVIIVVSNALFFQC